MEKKHKENEKVVKTLLGKEIALSGLVFTKIGKDTVDYYINQYEYKVFTYLRPSECVSCNLRLYAWKNYIEENKAALSKRVGYIFYYQVNNTNDIQYFLEKENFEYPVCIDLKGKLGVISELPQGIQYQTFLLNKENKIIAVGNPVVNSSVKQFYQSIMEK